MKYRIRSFQYRTQIKRVGTFRAKRTPTSLPRLLPPKATGYGAYKENINFNALFEYGELPSPPRKNRVRLTASRVAAAFRHLAKKIGAVALFVLKFVMLPFKGAGKSRPRLAFYNGVLVGAVIVTALSVTTVLVGLFGKYLLPYDTLTVPSLIGEMLSDVEAVDNSYELLVSYEHSTSVPAGVIISQKPDGGVTRKIYDSSSVPCVSVTVSMGKRFYTVPSLEGLTARDALLELKNNGVDVNTVYEYSSSTPIGSVISTHPATQSRIYDGESLTLKISLGKKIETVSVPDLYGLNEEAARTLLLDRGLYLGDISYRSSSADAGKIISQKYSPYSSVPTGTRIDVTVSIGEHVTEKTVPDLYGFSVEEAKGKLAEVGLVIGSIYSVSSGAPSGTVITQTPIANTPITSALTSVDLYVSS